MADKINDDLFEDVEYNEDLFEDVEYGQDQPEMDTSTGEAAIRGGAQGLTLGFADEITGGLGALGETLGITDPALGASGDQSILDRYKAHRDESRAEYDLAQKEHGAAYFGGELAGGILPALGTGGVSAAASLGKLGLKEAVKAGVKSGVRYGAAGGLGTSDAEIFDGDLVGTAKDVAIGAAVGGAMGGAVPYVGKGLEKAFSPIKTFGEVADVVAPEVKKRFIAGMDAAKAGRDIINPEASANMSKEFHGMFDNQFIDGVMSNISEGRRLKDIIFEVNPKMLKKAKSKETIKMMQHNISEAADNSIDATVSDSLNTLSNKLGKIIEDISEDKVSMKQLDDYRDYFYKEMNGAPKKVSNELNKLSQGFRGLVEDNLPKAAEHDYNTASMLMNKTLTAMGFLNKNMNNIDILKSTNAKDIVKNFIEDITKDSKSGRRAAQKFSHFEKQIAEAAGKLDDGTEVGLQGKAILEDLIPKMKVLVEQLTTSREVANGAPFSGTGTVSSQAIRLGYLIEKMKGGLKDIGKGAIEGGAESIPGSKTAAKSLKDAGISIKKQMGSPAIKKISDIAKLPNDSLDMLANRIRSTKPNVANFLSNLSKTEGKKKTALLFSASQNPSLRAWIQEMFDDE